MREFDVVLLRLTGRRRADEEAMTDLLNERARSGWEFHSASPLGTSRVAVVFFRDTP